jgi:hypothetical protein
MGYIYLTRMSEPKPDEIFLERQETEKLLSLFLLGATFDTTLNKPLTRNRESATYALSRPLAPDDG